MFEENFPDFTPIDCSLYPTGLPVEGQFDVPYFLSLLFRARHRGSFRMNTRGDIFIRNRVGPVSSPTVTFCMKYSDEHDPHPSKLRLTPLRRLGPFFTEIQIRHYPLFTIPDYFREYTSLHTLVLDDVQLAYIPDFLGDLRSLTILVLPRNKIRYLPVHVMSQLKNLTQLVLDGNSHLRSLEGINGHPSLTIVMARDCSIDRLPRDLPKLTQLYLSGNRLANLDGIETLGSGNIKEKSFFFDRNRIRSVPEEISSVKNLTHLNLKYNQLSDLPGGMLDIPSLTQLDIEYNCFGPYMLKLIDAVFRRRQPKFDLKRGKQRTNMKAVCPRN